MLVRVWEGGGVFKLSNNCVLLIDILARLAIFLCKKSLLQDISVCELPLIEATT